MNRINPAALAEAGEIRSDLSPERFARFAAFITAELGIKMADSKVSMLQSRLLRRVRDLGLSSVDDYAEYFFASANAEEREHFIHAITTHKTDFFREPEHFRFLQEVALPEAAARAARAGERVKVWSAGCSSGEEPYTLGMVLCEFALNRPGFDFAILGTDISLHVLEAADRGIYQESQVLPVPPELRRRYLMRSRNPHAKLVCVGQQLRRKVAFHQLNFMEDEYPLKDSFDIVFFRNVMIYFDRRTQETVLNKICRHLNPGGYLFAGHSESLSELDIPLKRVKTSMYRKPL